MKGEKLRESEILGMEKLGRKIKFQRKKSKSDMLPRRDRERKLIKMRKF